MLKETEASSDGEDKKESKPNNSCATNKTARLEPLDHKPVVMVLEDFDRFSVQVFEGLVDSLK